MLRTAAVAALLALAPAAAGARGPSTPDERTRAVKTTRRLEKEPLARGTNASREWLLQWIVEIPDISVTICSGPLDELAQDEQSSYAKLLYLQDGFGMAAFIIENPKRAEDWVAVQTAGIESVLRAYESVLRADSEARFDVLDRLLAARKAGQLRKLVETKMAKCGKPKDDEMGPAPGDAI